MRPCISQVTTLPTPFETDLPALAGGGWDLVEIWLPKLEAFLEAKTIAEARTLLTEHGLTATAAAGQSGLLSTTGDAARLLWDQYRRRLEWLAELSVPTLVLSADFPDSPDDESLERALSKLDQAAQLARARDVRVAFEFVKSGRFATSLDTALALINMVGAANLGLCLDVFHYYTGPSKFEDLAELSAANLFAVQVCDLSGVPRELAQDADRILPGEGDFQLDALLDHARAVGYDGPVTLEVLNPNLWEIAADRVAPIALQALWRTLGGRLDEALAITEAPD